MNHNLWVLISWMLNKQLDMCNLSYWASQVALVKNLPDRVMLQDIKLTHRNPLYSYTLTMRKQKEKLRKQYHSLLQQKE